MGQSPARFNLAPEVKVVNGADKMASSQGRLAQFYDRRSRL